MQKHAIETMKQQEAYWQRQIGDLKRQKQATLLDSHTDSKAHVQCVKRLGAMQRRSWARPFAETSHAKRQENHELGQELKAKQEERRSWKSFDPFS